VRLTTGEVPDLTSYRLQRRADPADFEGTAVPGLSADYFHRSDGPRTASAGRYHYAGVPLLLAWGYTDETHCRYSATWTPGGGWGNPSRGCPTVEVIHHAGRVIGIRVADHTGAWLTCQDNTVTRGERQPSTARQDGPAGGPRR
jgi:hypothetical protein